VLPRGWQAAIRAAAAPSKIPDPVAACSIPVATFALDAGLLPCNGISTLANFTAAIGGAGEGCWPWRQCAAATWPPDPTPASMLSVLQSLRT